ncbi:hypothetical protein A9Q99_22935 [Gammaproteobacteria bacterium 45_16_T64]|nr:hypothetical protein A9Q99_22935 [Gammaproteobacteria bacterium 45_16_T64]
MNKLTSITGAGLGLRRGMMNELRKCDTGAVDFFEVAPENWIGVGGKLKRQLHEIREHTPIICHGLSLSIGGPSALNEGLISDIKEFLNEHEVEIYSEHLSYNDDCGQMYDLLPLPFTEEAVHHVAARVRETQDRLGRRVALENISYYLVPEQDMSELEFVNAVVSESDCELLLDVNNIYVNSKNHQYDPHKYLQGLPGDKIRYVHVAGHFIEPDGVIIDTHGAAVVDPVWQLLEETYRLYGNKPTLLERDFNYPQFSELERELAIIHQQQSKCQRTIAA